MDLGYISLSYHQLVEKYNTGLFTFRDFPGLRDEGSGSDVICRDIFQWKCDWCKYEYKVGEKLRLLPCFHIMHDECFLMLIGYAKMQAKESGFAVKVKCLQCNANLNGVINQDLIGTGMSYQQFSENEVETPGGPGGEEETPDVGYTP